MNREKAVLCDPDGMLLDGNVQHAEAWQRAFAHFGIETTFFDVVRQIGNRGEHLIPVFVPEADRERLQSRLRDFEPIFFGESICPI
ncbi:MAG: hypothetical protein ACJ746_14030 [Bryobacteraceae bacterium]